MTTALVTGAAGYVGSHVARVLHDVGLRVIAVDDLSTSRAWPELPSAVRRVQGDVADRGLIGDVVARCAVDAVVHLAARTSVEESTRCPAIYYEQNAASTATLVDVVSCAPHAPIFVLASSAAVYGRGRLPRIDEDQPLAPISPYGDSKRLAEHVVETYAKARGFRWAALRYFNVAGAHPDGTLREAHDPETHLVPRAIDAALGRGASLILHGVDYPTPDGTCLRDYVHVMDLAEAHVAVLERLERGNEVGSLNLGAGRARSVREILDEVERVTGHRVPYEVGPRRAGDPPELVADVTRAADRVGWRPRRGLVEIVEDTVKSRRE